jgi:hypothetical protein
MGLVFINYRRDQTAGEARALYNDLVETLGPDRVFMDVDNIALGTDFRQVLRERLDASEVMLSLIGRDWADARDGAGQRRLDNAADFVRLEIATALQRNVAVTPVLLQGASMPAEQALPEDLKSLAFRNGFELSHTRWESDVHELVRRLGLQGATKAPQLAAVPAPAEAGVAGTARAKSAIAMMAAGAGVLAIAAGAAWMTMHRGPSTASPAPQQVSADPARVIASSPTAAVAAPEKAQDIERLIAQINDESAGSSRVAGERLRKEFAHSPLAVRVAIDQLAASNFQNLSRVGRTEVLRFLIASDDSAWTADRRDAAADAIRRIRQRIDAGTGHLVPQVLELLDQLGRRVGAPPS